MPVRVLHIVTYMGRGGLETMLMNYYRHINRDKVQFDFLVHRDFEADYDKEILTLGGKIYHISRLIPWSHSYREKLNHFFREHPEYKIVHVHQDCLSSVALQCAKECGILVRIAHSHNNAQDKNLKYLIKLYYMKKIPNYATDLFACSEAAGKWMFGEKAFQVVHNAIDIEKYKYSPAIAQKVRKQFNIENKIVIGHVGRFNPQKNHEFLIDIFAECIKRNSNVVLMLVGDGNGKKKIVSKVRALGINDKVIFMGVRSDVNELLQAMDVFVFPYGKGGKEVLSAYVEWMKQNSPEGWHRKKKYNYGNVRRMPKEDYLELILRMAKKQCSSAPESVQKTPEEHLTMMETVILTLIGKGRSNVEICEELNLKLSTVKSHIYSLYRKLGVKNRMQATIKGKEMGILK